MKKTTRFPVHSWLRLSAAVGSVLMGLLPGPARCQITPGLLTQLRSAIGDRVQALTILGGDYGLGGGHYDHNGGATTNHVDLSIDKFGGSGDVGDPEPLGDWGIGWQPRLQGNMGYVDAKNYYHSGLRNGDVGEYRTFAIQFGGGARFWFDDRFSIAPTFMGMFGHTSNEYTAVSPFMRANLAQARQLGLIDWNTDTWTIRPALNFQYVYTWDRTIITLSSDGAFFHTEGFGASNPNVEISGQDAGSLDNKVDVDYPLGTELYGHELRTGGYFSRTELYGGLKDGLQTSYLYEVHTRVVLDYLNQLWKVQWLGIGGSYFWGDNFTGWSVGVDVAFRF